MNDYEKLNKLLTELGVGFTDLGLRNGELIISCEAGGEKIEGYAGFCTEFVFNSNGGFISIEISE